MRTDKQWENSDPEIVYSRSIKAGRRIYYVDVKRDRNDDLFICITESKRTAKGESETPSFEKHKVFLYKEDFSHFIEGLEDAVNYVKAELGEIEERQEWTPESAPENSETEESPEAPAESAQDEQSDEQPKRRGLFGRIMK